MPFNVNEKSSTNLVSISKFLKGRVSPFFNTFIGVNIWHSGLGGWGVVYYLGKKINRAFHASFTSMGGKRSNVHPGKVRVPHLPK